MVQKCPRAAPRIRPPPLARQKKPNCDRRMHIAVNVIIFSSSSSWANKYFLIFNMSFWVYDICWFGVPRILNYSHSEKIFSWSLPDNLFILLVVIYLFGTWAIRSEPVSCLCVSALLVLIYLFGNSTIQKHHFIGLRWGVAVCICLVCSCLNILGSAWN